MEIRTGRPVTLAPNGMVTSPHSLASAAGVDVLRAGGSAIDAAIAASAVLSVVYPHMTGIGGDAFWLIHDGRTGKVRYLSGGGSAAASATLSWFASQGLGRSFRGHRPGDPDGAGRRRKLDRSASRPMAVFRSRASSKGPSTMRATASR